MSTVKTWWHLRPKEITPPQKKKKKKKTTCVRQINNVGQRSRDIVCYTNLWESTFAS